jgi:hypothetical protein
MGSLRTLKSATHIHSGKSRLCIRSTNQPNAIYLIDRGYLRHIPDRETLYNLYGDGYLPTEIKHQFFPKLPFGKPMDSGSYLLRCRDTGEIFLAAPSLRVIRPVSNDAMQDYGFYSAKIRNVNTEEDLPAALLGEALRPK